MYPDHVNQNELVETVIARGSISSEIEYDEVMIWIEKNFISEDVEVGKLMESVIPIVEAYEELHFPIGEPTEQEIREFLIGQGIEYDYELEN